MEDLKVLVEQYKALGDENRLAIIQLLKQGEQCACVLLEQLDLSQSGLSYHMKKLVDAGIVDERPEGKWVYYRISNEGCKQFLSNFKTLTESVDLVNH
ncbi:ArsR/SmtB family transcription factor [Facklamia miroungae]|uniref:ArsR family transcriptional regulator n=1 Tax=Facklamia miroungae TaxID=120956 RepID=A0A1G7TB71_9LACT|nr:metalloregulator ArsR/SmtB family transcription factor [Facklamia miroungae]NKZ29723.1 winged helix-turn-helix transcriptional regulator [Facklamia miroungae]SDG31879.1 ArsR family transcriptional regulator [Facklamia miroungae]